MRELRAALVVLALAATNSVARADAIPGPGRPEWDDTPMPMPGEPPDAATLVVGLLCAGGAAWAMRRAARRA